MGSNENKIARGGAAYLLRHGVVTALSFLSNFFLIKFLSPADLGAFAIINVCIVVIALFSEGGLNVFLIRKQGAIDQALVNQIFSLQLFIAVVCQALAVVFLLITWWFDYGFSTVFPVFFVCLAIFPSLVRSMSFVFLEKKMEFVSVAMIEGLESLSYSIAVVIFAWIGFGVWAIVIATIIRSTLGFFLAFHYYPFDVKLARPKITTELRAGIVFGLHYNTSNFFGILRSVATPLFVGTILGLTAVGLCDRSGFIAGIPLMIIGLMQARILFPYFSGLQNDLVSAFRSYKRTVYMSGVLDKALYVPLVLALPILPSILGMAWEPAILVMEIMIYGNMLFGAFISSSVPFLNGLGLAKWLAWVSALSTLLMWLVGWALLKYFGIIGFAYLSLINWLPLVWLWLKFRRQWPKLYFIKELFVPVAAAIGSIVFIQILLGKPSSLGFWSLLKPLAGVSIYILFLYALGPVTFIGEVKAIVFNLMNRERSA